MDAAGVVDEVGDGVSDVATGDAVLGIGLATYAEYAVLNSWTVKPRRSGLARGEVRALAPDGVDAVLHLAGDGLIPDLMELTGEPGRVLTLADYRAGQYGVLLSQRPVNPAAAPATRLSIPQTSS